MRNLLSLLLLALLAAAPLAAAQDEKPADNSTRPDDAAWVEDCPPDMMCAAGAGDEPTSSGDCGAEVCAYGNDSCIECSGPVDNGSTCMDGAQDNETCRDDVYYMDGPSRGPADGSCENCRGEEADPVSVDADASSAKDVPALGVAAIVAAFLVALVAAGSRL